MLTTERLVIGLLNRARQKCVGKSIWEDASPYIKITFHGTHTSQGRLAHAMALENIRCPSTHKSFSQWRSFAIGTHTLSVDPRKSGAIHTLLSLKSTIMVAPKTTSKVAWTQPPCNPLSPPCGGWRASSYLLMNATSTHGMDRQVARQTPGPEEARHKCLMRVNLVERKEKSLCVC